MKNLLFVIVAGIFLSLQAGIADVPQEGLILHLTFDEGAGTVARDAGPNAFEASLEGDYTWAQGKSGSAVEFTLGSAMIPDDDRLDVEQTTALAWIFPTAIKEDAFDAGTAWYGASNIICNKSGASDDSFALGLYKDGGVFFYIDQGANNVQTIPDAGVQTNQWYHIAATFDSVNMMVYLDGELVGEKPVVGTIIPNDNEYRIGGRPDQSVSFEGIIDEFAAFDRALTEEEIEEIMDSTIAVEPGGKLTTTWSAIKVE